MRVLQASLPVPKIVAVVKGISDICLTKEVFIENKACPLAVLIRGVLPDRQGDSLLELHGVLL